MLKNAKLDSIKKCLLFQGCTDQEISLIAEHVVPMTVKQGDPIYVINDISTHVYLIMNGSVDIVAQGNVKNQFYKVRQVKPNEHFGELSVLTSGRHSTSAFAREKSEILSIESRHFLELIRQVGSISQNQIALLLSSYIHDLTHQNFLPELLDESECRYEKRFAKIAPVKIPSYRKAVPLRIEANIITFGFCLPLSSDLVASIRSQLPKYQIKFVLIDENQFESFRKAYLNFYSGPSAGQTGQISPKMTTASQTVIADDLDDLRMSTLLLSQLSPSTFKDLAPFFESRDYAEGELIFGSEQKSDRFYFVGSGEVELLKNVDGLDVLTSFTTVDQYDVFFDTSLFREGDHRVTAIARSTSRIFSLNKETLYELLSGQDFAVPFAITLAQLMGKLNKKRPGLEYYAHKTALIDPHTQNLLPHSRMIKSRILPLELIDKDLTIGVVVPRQEMLDDAIETYFRGYNIKISLLTEEQFAKWTVEIRESIVPENSVSVYVSTLKDNRFLKSVDANPTVAIEQILEGAIDASASDIHLEPNEKNMLIRYRIDGVIMQLWDAVPIALGHEILRRLKVLAKMNIAESRLPQDGQFKFTKGKIESSFRLSSVPIRFGEKIVLRATGRKNSVIPLPLLAPDTKITKFFNRLVKYQQGIFFITGPTGSGKSTTLYSILAELNRPDRNVITVEDPIEANITGINQIEINPGTGLTHEIILRNILRQDPDVIMIGEIRDEVSMQLALDAALSGQLVLATIHAGNTFEVIPRIKELGGKTSHIASGLIGVMAQRLVRRLCTSCKKPQAVTSKEIELFSEYKLEALTQVMGAVGCSKCNFTGFSGQLPIFEFWEKSVKVHNALMDDASSEEIARAIRESNIDSLTAYGLKMVAQGLTTVSEVNEVLFGIVDLMAS